MLLFIINRCEENYDKALILFPLICLVGGLSSCHSGDVTISGTKPITTIKMGVKYYDRDYLVWYLDREHFDENMLFTMTIILGIFLIYLTPMGRESLMSIIATTMNPGKMKRIKRLTITTSTLNGRP